MLKVPLAKYRYKCQIMTKQDSVGRWLWCVYHGYRLLAVRYSFDLAFKSMVTWQKVMTYASH